MSRPKGGEGVSDCVSDVLGKVHLFSNALPYMEWPAIGYFHWSIVIAPPVVHSLQPHYRLSQLASTVWLVQK